MIKNLVSIFIICAISSCVNNDFPNDRKVKIINEIDILIGEANKVNNSLEEKLSNAEKSYSLIDQLENSTVKRKKIQSLSKIYFLLKRYDRSSQMDQEMLRVSYSINDSLGMAISHSYIGITHSMEGSLDSSFKHFYKADKIYKSFDRSNKYKPKEYYYDHGKVLMDLAKLFRKTKDYIESENLTISAINKFQISGNKKYYPWCYKNLGILSKYLGRYDDAINYHLKSIEYAKNTNVYRLYNIPGYNNIGTVYKSKGDYKNAIFFYNKALTDKDISKVSVKTFARIIDNLGYVKYLIDKDDKESFNLMNKAYLVRDSIKDISGLPTSSLHLSEYFKSNSKLDSAEEFAKKAERFSMLANDNEELLQAYQLLSEVSEPKAGLEYAQKYIALNDSLIKEERLYRDKFARIRFETDQKEQQIIKVQNQNTVYLLGMLLLLSLIGFALFFFRQRTKYLAQQNKIVQTRAAYETETRISKRLHDELGNDIFQVMLQYQNNPHDPEIVNRLNITYNKARDISRENSEFEVDETYGEELADMLQNYSNNGVQLILRGLDKLDWDNFSSTVKIAIYRVLQELMTNMQKHSQATLVALIFTYDTKKLIIKYSDNGVGIPADQLTSKNGLRNTEKRIKAVNGTFTYESKKDQGFKVFMEIPV